MKIERLKLVDFRNYKSASVDFADGLNVICGDNAVGKTNMIESIYLCSIFKSPRASSDKELVNIGCQNAKVSMSVKKRFSTQTISMQIDAKGSKKALVDGLPLQRAGELFGVLGAVYFSPDEMKLVKEAPQERRKFIDVGLCQQQRNYFYALQRYNKTLKQKNNLLKEWQSKKGIDQMLDVWDAGLAKEGAIIIKKRMEYVEVLNAAAGKFHRDMSGEKEVLKLSYESSLGIDGVEPEKLEEVMIKALLDAREKDKRLGFSTVGPHRDDLKIEINEKDSRKFASQGQQRTIALALKLGELIIYKDEIGEPPVLLLDDVLSELDDSRQRLLMEMTKGFQTFLTCTKFDMKVPCRKILIDSGKIVKVTDEA